MDRHGVHVVTTPALPSEMRHQIAEQNRHWRIGCEAGLSEPPAPASRCLVIDAFVLLRHHVHPPVRSCARHSRHRALARRGYLESVRM